MPDACSADSQQLTEQLCHQMDYRDVSHAKEVYPKLIRLMAPAKSAPEMDCIKVASLG